MKVGLRELYANQLGVRGSQVVPLSPCNSQTQPEALWKGRSQQPVTPMKGEASPGLPLPSRIKGESVQLQLHTTLPGPQATDRPTVTHHAGLLLLPWAGTCCAGAPDSGPGQEQGRRAGEEEAGAGSWQGPKASLPALE